VFAAIPVTDIGSQAGSSRTNCVATDMCPKEIKTIYSSSELSP